MKFKKFVSTVLGLTLFMSNGLYCGATSGVDSKIGGSDVRGNVVFVPDEKITIDSAQISALLDTQFARTLASMPLFIGDMFDELFGSSEKKRLRFVSPDENSSNPLSRELFPDGSPRPEDVKQSRLGLCYFFAVLSTVAEKDPELIKNSLVDDGKGNVIVRFFDPSDGSPYYVKVQKTVPQIPESCKFVSNDCLWVQMYLKAFVASGFSGVRGYLIKGFGKKNYRYAEGGQMDLVMRMITGRNTEIKNALTLLLSKQEELYKKIEKTLSKSGYVTCDFSAHLNVIKMIWGAPSNEGLVRGHAYSIERVYEDEEGQKWIVIRNPWGHFVSTYDENGKRILSPSDDSNNGYSVLKFGDFLDMCGRITFTKNERIEKRGIIKRVSDLIDPVPYAIRVVEISLLRGLLNYIRGKLTNEEPEINFDMISSQKSLSNGLCKQPVSAAKNS